MHISKASKAVFILANYVTANLVPPHLKINVRLNQGSTPGDDDTSDLNSDSITGTSANTPSVPKALLPRQESCDQCRTRCPTNKIIHPTKCRRCIRCPPGKKADPTSRICVDGNPEPDQEDKDKRKEEREKEYQRKKQDKRQEYKVKRYDVKKERERNKYQANEERKKDNERRKKVRRAGRCLPLVAMAMGPTVAAEFAEEFFDEAYLESMDLEQFWPEDVPIEPWDTEDSDKLFEEDEYIDKWIAVGNDGGESATVSGITLRRRTVWRPDGSLVEGVGVSDDLNDTLAAPVAPGEILTYGPDGLIQGEIAQKLKARQPTDIMERSGNGDLLEPRLAFLIPIFAAVAGTVARVAAGAARAGGNLLKLTRYTVKIGTGKSSKKSFKEQSDGAKKISQSKNWKNCLTRGNPGA
ncbi:hypothetical protein V8F20_010517 [Naviculisporaceae sp. PSN 640]